jgi:hypothetical protein
LDAERKAHEDEKANLQAQLTEKDAEMAELKKKLKEEKEGRVYWANRVYWARLDVERERSGGDTCC